MTQLVLEPAVRQLELLRSGEVSVRELAEAHLHQIARLNPALNVFAIPSPPCRNFQTKVMPKTRFSPKQKMLIFIGVLVSPSA